MKEPVKFSSSGRTGYVRNRLHRPLRVVQKIIDDKICVVFF